MQGNGKWDSTFSKTGSYRFRQFVTRVGESRDDRHPQLCRPHPACLQPPETLPQSSALTAPFSDTKALHSSPRPQRRKSTQ